MSFDPRGPIRTITKVEKCPKGGSTTVHKSCGHSGPHAQHFSYKVGSSIHCFRCRPDEDPRPDMT